MEKLTDVTAALDAGKLPSQNQINGFISWVQATTLPVPTANDELSRQGRILADSINECLEAHKQLGSHKNGDDLLQEIIFHLSASSPSSVSLTSPAASAQPPSSSSTSEEATADLQQIQQALLTLLHASYASLSSESSTLFADFTAFTRLTLSDAAELVEGGAAATKDYLRDVDAGVQAGDRDVQKGERDVQKGERDVQKGERDTLGRDKKRVEAEAGDAKVQWEHGMDTLKGAGSGLIETGRSVKGGAEEVGERTNRRAQEAFYKICTRAQRDPEYKNAVSTLFDLVEKWVSKPLDAAQAANPASSSSSSPSLEDFIDDPTPEQHVPKALRALKTLTERLSGDVSLSPALAALQQVVVDVRADPDLRGWFGEVFGTLRRALEEPGYATPASGASGGGASGDGKDGEVNVKDGKSEFAKDRKALAKKYAALLDADSEKGKKWKADVAAFKGLVGEFEVRLSEDADLKRLGAAHGELGKALGGGLMSVGRVGAGKAVDKAGDAVDSAGGIGGIQAVLEQVSWFWQDLFKVYVPKVLGMMRDLPIPRTEYKDTDIELVLENIDISSFDLNPAHVYIRNITDIDITTTTPSSTAPSKTSIGTLTHIRLQAIQLALNDVSFYYHDLRTTLGPAEISGLLTFTLPPKGVDVDIKVRLIPADASTPVDPAQPTGHLARGGRVPERELKGCYHEIEKIEVRISEELDLSIRDSNHPLLLTVFKPIVAMRARDALEKALTLQLRSVIEKADRLAWDVSKRAEVFGDAGLGGGGSVVAALWSEVGKYRRVSAGGVRATGTGVVYDEKMAVDGEGGAQFAVGVEPQILSGEKRGPKGTASEPLGERLKAVAPIDVDVEGGAVEGAQGATEEVLGQAKEVGKQVKGLVEEGKRQVGSFRESVQRKSEEEKKKEGWRSDAFDL